jgi:hypothetical protein
MYWFNLQDFTSRRLNQPQGQGLCNTNSSSSGVRLGNGLLQNTLNKRVQGLSLIHGIAYQALVKIGIKAKIEGTLEWFFRLLVVSRQNSR